MKAKVAVIDDDADYLQVLRMKLENSGFEDVVLFDDPEKAASLFEGGAEFDIALIDMTMPGMDGAALLELVKRTSPETECIMVTAVNEARVAVECMKSGAYDYLLKPVSQDELKLAVGKALERKRLLDILEFASKDSVPESVRQGPFRRITTRCQNVLKVLKFAQLHAAGDIPVLITGESGTGKELLARAVHDASPRAGRVFTAVNMASLSPGLFDSEFFGHARGAFTGADKKRAGYLEFTHGGSLFLDEIGILPPELQGKLLRVLQSGEYIKLGESEQRRADIRIIAATNENLEDLIAEKRFRKDLYYRLRGGCLHIPPLRERKDDIPLLIGEFVEEFCDGESESRCALDEKSLELLMAYDYPGNVRELKSIIRAGINFADGGAITPAMLPDEVRAAGVAPRAEKRGSLLPETETIVPLSEIEREHIVKAYRLVDRNKSRAARELGIGLNTLRRKLKSYGVD